MQNSNHSLVRITYLLKHRQEKNLNQIKTILEENQFWEHFPSQGSKIINWQVLVGKGHFITLECETDKLRDLNLVIETRAWGAFETETYLSYDYLPIFGLNNK